MTGLTHLRWYRRVVCHHRGCRPGARQEFYRFEDHDGCFE